MTKEVQIGSLRLGGGNPVLVQSMTNTDTRDTEATLRQICALHEAGCDLVRVSVYDEACAEAVRELADRSPVPLVADIHFDHRLAIRSAETASPSCGSIRATSAVKRKYGNWRIARKHTIFRSGLASTADPWKRTCWQNTADRQRNAWWKARSSMRGCWKRSDSRISC